MADLPDWDLYKQSFRQGLRILRDAGGGWWPAWLVLLVVPAVFPPLLVYLTPRVVDGLAAAIRGADAVPMWEAAAAFGAVMVAQNLVGAVQSYVQANVDARVRDHVQGLVQERALAASMGQFEDHAFHDLLHRARIDGVGAPVAIVAGVLGVGRTVLGLAAVIAILVPLGLVPFAAFVIAAGPVFVISRRQARENHAWRRQRTGLERRGRYRDDLLTQLPSAPEVRVAGIGPRLRAEYTRLRTRLRESQLRLMRRHLSTRTAAGVWAIGVMGALMAWMVQQAIRGAISIGQLTMYYTAYRQAQSLASGLGQSGGALLTSALGVEVLHEFLETPIAAEEDGGVDPTRHVRGAIRFDDVAFRYPGAEAHALLGLNLDIPAGATVAVVGANGAGKSTLVKLALGLHAPTRGRVTIDGVPITDLDAAAFRAKTAVVFQRPIRLETDVKGNVLLSLTADETVADLTNVPLASRQERLLARKEGRSLTPAIAAAGDGVADAAGDAEATNGRATTNDDVRLGMALQASGADEVVRALPRGLETPLGRRFGGLELSGGQWQRLALARALYRDTPILVLDEPTTGMDPWAEEAWLGHFQELARDRTTLIISHRMKAARLADKIYVVENGHVVEAGNHDELMQQDGRYARAWRFDSWGDEEPDADEDAQPDASEETANQQVVA